MGLKMIAVIQMKSTRSKRKSDYVRQ